MAVSERSVFPLPADSISTFSDIIYLKSADQRRQLAKKTLMRSCFFPVCHQLRGEIGGEISMGYEEDIKGYYANSLIDDSVFIQITWDQDYDGQNLLSASTLYVEAFPEGGVVVHGNLVGSTILSEAEVKNRAIRIEALQKACLNPHRIGSQNL